MWRSSGLAIWTAESGTSSCEVVVRGKKVPQRLRTGEISGTISAQAVSRC